MLMSIRSPNGSPADEKDLYCIIEIFESTAEFSTKKVSVSGVRAKERLLAQVRQEPVKAFSIIIAGSILVSLLLGYCISRMEERSRRQRLMEDWMQEVANWIREHGRKIAAPIKGGLEATKSAVEEASHSGARVGRHVYPFFKKQRRSFLNLFEMYVNIGTRYIAGIGSVGKTYRQFQKQLEDR
jgi:hypothetical protein